MLRSGRFQVWRSILESQSVIKEGCRRRIGDGMDTRVWQVPWLPYTNNGYLITLILDELKYMTVRDLMNDNHSNWDVDVLQDLCTDRDKELIQQIPIPITPKLDT